MLRALERSTASAPDRILFLAPSARAARGAFRDVDVDGQRHARLLEEVQRFRGAIYLKDGAITPDQLTVDQRHRTAEDDESWHMLLLDEHRRVSACALYLEHGDEVSFDRLRVRHCAMAQDPEWRPKLEAAVGVHLDQARREGMRYVELGGWAVAEESRGTSGPLGLALAVYGFSRRGAGALGMTTATVRHCSSTILRRLGGARFEIGGATLPPYYDERYRCLMELLHFDSRKPNQKYLGLIDQVRSTLESITVIARPSGTGDTERRGAEGPVYGHALAS